MPSNQTASIQKIEISSLDSRNFLGFSHKETDLLQKYATFSKKLSTKISTPQIYLKKKQELLTLAYEGLRLSKIFPSCALESLGSNTRPRKILSKSTGIYKKNRSVFKESLVYELSLLLGCDQWISPSMPVYIHGENATFQPYCKIQNMTRFIPDKAPLPVDMSLEDYWILVFFVLLTGQQDLNGDNLHFTENGFFFVDTDCSFPPTNKISAKLPYNIYLPLDFALLDFDIALQPLSNSALTKINETINQWKNKEEEIDFLFKLYPYFEETKLEAITRAFKERWKIVCHTPIRKNSNMREHFTLLFPSYFKDITTAQSLASYFLGKEIGPMSSLHFLGKFAPNMEFDQPLKEKLSLWIKLNHL